MGYTSSKIKNKWNAEHYAQVNVKLDKDLIQAFKSKCKKDNISMAEIIKAAIIEFLKEG